MPALPYASTYGPIGTWNTEDPEGEGFAGINEDGPPRQRQRQIFRGPTSRFDVNPTLFGAQQSVANANSEYLSTILPNERQALASFDANYLGGGTGAPGVAAGTGAPRWIRNRAGGFQTAPDATHPVMSMGPIDAQLVTKSPVTGQPWQDSPLIPPGYKPGDVTAQRAKWGWGAGGLA